MSASRTLSCLLRFTAERLLDFADALNPATTSSPLEDYFPSTSITSTKPSGPILSDYDLMEDLDSRACTYWKTVDKRRRKECVDHLDGWIGVDDIRRWKREGFGDGFHMFGGGMQVRNRLREVMKDDELPPVEYDSGPAQTWDDYYMGVLYELLERY